MREKLESRLDERYKFIMGARIMKKEGVEVRHLEVYKTREEIKNNCLYWVGDILRRKQNGEKLPPILPFEIVRENKCEAMEDLLKEFPEFGKEVFVN